MCPQTWLFLSSVQNLARSNRRLRTRLQNILWHTPESRNRGFRVGARDLQRGGSHDTCGRWMNRGRHGRFIQAVGAPSSRVNERQSMEERTSGLDFSDKEERVDVVKRSTIHSLAGDDSRIYLHVRAEVSGRRLPFLADTGAAMDMLPLQVATKHSFAYDVSRKLTLYCFTGDSQMETETHGVACLSTKIGNKELEVEYEVVDVTNNKILISKKQVAKFGYLIDPMNDRFLKGHQIVLCYAITNGPTKAKGGEIQSIQIQRMYPGAVLPERTSDGFYKLRACKAFDITPGFKRTITLGYTAQLPKGWNAIIPPLSDAQGRHGIHILHQILTAPIPTEVHLTMENRGLQKIRFRPSHVLAEMAL